MHFFTVITDSFMIGANYELLSAESWVFLLQDSEGCVLSTKSLMIRVS